MAALRSRPPAFERSGARRENGQSRGKIFKNKMARNIIKVLDIVSQSAKALAAEVRAGEESLRILGAARVRAEKVWCRGSKRRCARRRGRPEFPFARSISLSVQPPSDAKR